MRAVQELIYKVLVNFLALFGALCLASSSGLTNPLTMVVDSFRIVVVAGFALSITAYQIWRQETIR